MFPKKEAASAAHNEHCPNTATWSGHSRARLLLYGDERGALRSALTAVVACWGSALPSGQMRNLLRPREGERERSDKANIASSTQGQAHGTSSPNKKNTQWQPFTNSSQKSAHCQRRPLSSWIHEGKGNELRAHPCHWF